MARFAGFDLRPEAVVVASRHLRNRAAPPRSICAHLVDASRRSRLTEKRSITCARPSRPKGGWRHPARDPDNIRPDRDACYRGLATGATFAVRGRAHTTPVRARSAQGAVGGQKSGSRSISAVRAVLAPPKIRLEGKSVAPSKRITATPPRQTGQTQKDSKSASGAPSARLACIRATFNNTLVTITASGRPRCLRRRRARAQGSRRARRTLPRLLAAPAPRDTSTDAEHRVRVQGPAPGVIAVRALPPRDAYCFHQDVTPVPLRVSSAKRPRV